MNEGCLLVYVNVSAKLFTLQQPQVKIVVLIKI